MKNAKCFNSERLLVEKDVTLQKAMEITQSMEAATKQSSELHRPSGSAPTSQFTTIGKDLLQMWKQKTSNRNVILKHKI